MTAMLWPAFWLAMGIEFTRPTTNVEVGRTSKWWAKVIATLIVRGVGVVMIAYGLHLLRRTFP